MTWTESLRKIRVLNISRKIKWKKKTLLMDLQRLVMISENEDNDEDNDDDN